MKKGLCRLIRYVKYIFSPVSPLAIDNTDAIVFLYLLQQERDRLLAEVESLAATSDGQTQKMQDIHLQKLKTLEAQVGHLCRIIMTMQ